MDLAALLDERAVIAVADGLDRAVDAKDWAAARAAFADTIVFSASPDGSGAGEMAADALLGLWRENLHPGKASFHLRGNHGVTLSGDTAELVSNAYAWNRQTGVPGGDLWEVWGVYRYGFRRTGDGWRIVRFDFRPVLDRGNAAVPGARP